MDSILHPNKDKKRSDSKDRLGQEKRSSLTLRPGHGKSKSSESSPRLGPVRAGRFEVIIESGPLICYGRADSSTGALLSGRLKLHVQDPSGEVTLVDLTLILRAVTSTKKPVVRDCPECKDRHDVLKKENLLSEPKTFKKSQDNQFPFSHLFDGRLPASTVSPLGSVSYQLVATARTVQGEIIEIIHPLIIQRAITAGLDRTNFRIFPPTHLTCRVQHPPVVHPIGNFPLQFMLSGVVEKKTEAATRWRLNKVIWHVEEITKWTPQACPHHVDKLKESKTIPHTDTKIIAHGEEKSGWKTDFDTAGGEINFEFEVSACTKSNHRPVCDVDSSTGLDVKHALVIELIIAEEFITNRNPKVINPTGAARVLRMSFQVIVSERAGMNISWDEEMPPVYEDVPESPPCYGNAESVGNAGGASISIYTGPQLEYNDLERVRTDNPNDPPQYRERDANAGLPMRDPTTTSTTAAGPSGTQSQRGRSGFTEDELEAEPPRFMMRRRSSAERREDRPTPEDHGEGTSSSLA